jgi:hypothetical protein
VLGETEAGHSPSSADVLSYLLQGCEDSEQQKVCGLDAIQTRIGTNEPDDLDEDGGIDSDAGTHAMSKKIRDAYNALEDFD